MCSLWWHSFSIWLINLRCYTKQWDTAAPHLWSHLNPAAAGDVLKGEVMQGLFREWRLEDYSEEKIWSKGARTEQGCRVGSWNSTVVRWCTVLKVSCSSGTVGSNSKCSVDVSTDRPLQDVDFRIPTNDYRVRSREVQRRWLMFEIELTEGWTNTKRSPKRPHIVRGLSDLRVLASILLFPVWWVHGRFMYVNQRRHARQRPKQPSKTKSLKENITLLLLLYCYCYILNVQCKFTLSFLQLFALKFYCWIWRNKCNTHTQELIPALTSPFPRDQTNQPRHLSLQTYLEISTRIWNVVYML